MWEKIKKIYQKYKSGIYILLFSFIVWGMIMQLQTESKNEDIKEMSYNTFVKMCDEGKVDTVYYNKTKEYMTVTFFNKKTKKMSIKKRKAYKYKASEKRKVLYPGYDEFRKDMLKKNVNLSLIKSSTLEDILSVTATLVFPVFWIFLLFKLMNVQSRGLNKNDILQTSDVKFEDVIGQDEIVEDIRFIAELIKDPKMSESIGAKVPKGVLLAGPPGTGKTLIAKAIAGEAGVPFVSMSGSDFKELYVGVGAKRVRELFKIARKNAPCIIFIDEIDSVGAKRNATGSTSEDSQTINALLKEMDGFTGRENIFILAATNHPENLDSALIRSGRFDRKITINPPRDWHVRKKLFEHYLKDYKISDDINLETLSKTVSGFTGADIAMICNEAGIIAIMHKKECVDNACIEEAIDKKIFNGNRSKHKSIERDKEIVAYHESGHAVMSYLLGEPIARASIIGTTSGVGGAVFRQDKSSFFITKKELKNHIMIAYAGRASEEIKFDDVTTGASNDITQATQTLIAYVEKYGFDSDFGLVDMGVLENDHFITNNEMTKRISKMSKEMYNETVDLLNEKYDLVEMLAKKLLEEETLSGNEIEELFDEA